MSAYFQDAEFQIFYPLKDEENFEILWLKLIYLSRKPINPYPEFANS